MADFDVKDMLPLFKRSIGDLTPSTELDDYYLTFLNMAASELLSNDISEEVLTTDLGSSAVVLTAKAFMEGRDVATDPTLTLLRNTLSVQTKGIRYVDGS